MQSIMNAKIKFRESFRPFAPAVLRERAHAYFELRPDQDSPYMLLTARVRAEQRLPAVTHVDGSARIQTVDARRNPRLHAILRAFERRTGCAVVVNTSFNVRGEPIVNTPAQALRCFLATGMDALVLEHCVLLKADQPPAAPGASDYLGEFAPD
jgi:carbamoyltransferase